MDEQTKSILKGAQVAVTEKVILDYLKASNLYLTDQQKKMFIQVAVLNSLNPFFREIYPITYGNSFKLVTGYTVYIKRAEASGKLDGWKVESDGETATITIYRKDFQHPIEWSIKRADFDKGTGNWKSMQDFMLRKVCIAQGFRLAFPNEISSLPFLAEELVENEGTGTGAVKLNPPKVEEKTPGKRTAKTKEEINHETEAKNLKHLYDQVLELCGNNKGYVNDLVMQEGLGNFMQLTLPQAFKILNYLREQKKEEVHA